MFLHNFIIDDKIQLWFQCEVYKRSATFCFWHLKYLIASSATAQQLAHCIIILWKQSNTGGRNNLGTRVQEKCQGMHQYHSHWSVVQEVGCICTCVHDYRLVPRSYPSAPFNNRVFTSRTGTVDRLA